MTEQENIGDVMERIAKYLGVEPYDLERALMELTMEYKKKKGGRA